MPQPTISGAPLTLQFGRLALPNGQGTLSPLNLNDGTTWQWQDFKGDDDFVQHAVGQLAWRAKGAFLGQDAKARTLTLPMRYQEGATTLGAALAQLSQAGAQYISFDGSTAILGKYAGARNRVMLKRFSPFYWSFDLEFLCPTPWFQDLSSTALTTVNVVNAPTAAPSGAAAAGGALTAGTYKLQYTYVTASGETAPSPASSNIVLSGGNLQISVSAVTPLPSFATAVKWYFQSGPTTGFTVQNSGGAFTLNTAGNGTPAPSSTPATAFTVAYAGSVFAEPVWVLTIPSSNTGVITSATLANTMAGESLTVTFPGGLAASTAYVITIDAGAFTAIDGSGVAYDVSGGFPNLHPPAGQSNALTVAAATSSGVPAGLTLGGSWFPRWEL